MAPTEPALSRPQGLSDETWAAITDAADRLQGAVDARDHALVVGSAKELCESVAKVVISGRGGPPERGADMPDLVSKAHKLLEFQPGEGVASDPEVRQVAQGVKSVVLGLAELRNRVGTGHGRAGPTGVQAEHAELAHAASHMWSSWALRRLEPYVAGDVGVLVQDLESRIFRRGQLASRLEYANLPRLSVEDQTRIGTAVARRAARGTFVVRDEGVSAADAEDATAWPEGYVQGIITGLLFDAEGNLDINKWKLRESSRLIFNMTEGRRFLEVLTERIEAAASAGAWTAGEDARLEANAELARITTTAESDDLRDLWRRISDAVAGAAEPELDQA